ncbi:MAG: hypothetical protein JSW09_00625, partial [Pseudomonadota bacterium]
LPAALRGRVTAEVWSEWEGARPAATNGSFQIQGLALPVARRVLSMQEATGELDWRRRGDGWRLKLTNATLGLRDAPRTLGTFQIVHRPDDTRVEARRVYLEDLTSVVQTLTAKRTNGAAGADGLGAEPADVWSQLAPRGVVEHLKVKIDGSLPQPERFSAKGEVHALSTAAVGQIPGVKGLHGKFSVSKTDGELELQPSAVAVAMPRLFRDTIQVHRATGKLSWQRTEDYWRVVGDKLRVVSPDVQASGTMRLQVPHAADEQAQLWLRVDYEGGNGAHAARYYPIRYLPEKTRVFLEQSILAGEITRGHLVYEGKARDFPFRDGSGKFEIVGHVRNGVYQYLPGWEPIRKANVDVVIRQGDVRITGNGRIGRLELQRADVQLELPGGASEKVIVRGTVKGTVGDALFVLSDVKWQPGKKPPWKAYLPQGLTAVGDGTLELSVDVPYGDAPAAIDGKYLVHHATLNFATPRTTIKNVEGHVRFTEKGVNSGTLRGQLLGGDSLAVFATADDGTRELRASGRLFPDKLTPIIGDEIGTRLAGDAVWHLRWQERAGRMQLQAEMPLDALTANLPAPLDRPHGLARTPLQIKTEASTSSELTLGISVGEEATGHITLARGAEGWQVRRGRVEFGAAHADPPSADEMQVAVRAATVDLDGWIDLLGGRTMAASMPPILARLGVDTQDLILFNRNFGRATAMLSAGKDGWEGDVKGDAAEGQLRFETRPQPKLEVNFARLHVPARRDETTRTAHKPTDPRHLPALEARVESLTVKGFELGRFELRGRPTPDGWESEQFRVERGELQVTGSGRWLGGGYQPVKSEVSLKFETQDAGRTLTSFRYPDQMLGGRAQIDTTLHWPGSPADIEAAIVSGHLDVTSRDGQFLRAKTGAARLFGILDLSSLGRYLQLDFSPIFGKGFVYDEVSGTVTLERGNAYTQDLRIKGPAATLTFNGRIGLAAEDYELFLGIAPKFSAGVTLTTFAFFGPVVAAATAAIQQMFKDQITEGTRIIYVVKGSWQEPDVTRLAAPASEPASQ